MAILLTRSGGHPTELIKSIPIAPDRLPSRSHLDSRHSRITSSSSITVGKSYWWSTAAQSEGSRTKSNESRTRQLNIQVEGFKPSCLNSDLHPSAAGLPGSAEHN